MGKIGKIHTTMPNKRQTSLLFLVSLVVTLVAAEGIVRVVKPVSYRPPEPPVADDVWRTLVHRRSGIPGLAYELESNTDRLAMGSYVRTNSLGMRDAELREGGNVVRIAVIGDSFTFGMGVPVEATYPHQLEELLNQTSEGPTYDVMNFGVGGYNTRDEALVLEYKVLPLRPRAIIVGYFLNDPQITPIQPLQRSFHKTEWWRYSTLLRLLAMNQYGRDLERFGGGDYYRYLHNDPEKWQSVVDGFAHMANRAGAAGVPVLVMIFPVTPKTNWEEYPYRDLHEKVSQAALEQGLLALDLYEAFAQFEPSTLRLGENDPHPTALGYRVAARVIQARLPEILSAASPVDAPRS